MLQQQTVSRKTLELIQQIQADPFFESFVMVGGTALALQIGHRISVDIDFFTRKSFDIRETLEYLEQQYNFQTQYSHTHTLKGIINGIFADFIRHDYEYVQPVVEQEGIKMASLEDIAAMKVNAICGNGTRIKDFIDIYFLLQKFSFGEIISFYRKKYKSRNEFHAVKSLTYFQDIISENRPEMLIEKDLNLDKIKKLLVGERDRYLKNSI